MRILRFFGFLNYIGIMEAHEHALSKAKIALMQKPDSVFFATVCFSLAHEFDTGIPTAATNGAKVRYNPEFFMQLNADERLFLVLHETLHVAYLHMGRRNGRDPYAWNAACDYVINLMLVDRGFKMPKDGLLDEKYRGMSAEQVYNSFPKDEDFSDVMNDLEESADLGAAKEVEEKVTQIVMRAAMQSAMMGDKPGTIPGDIQVMLNNLVDPKLPWQMILRKYLQKYAKSDYTLRKPRRRYLPKLFLPGLLNEAMVDFSVAVDCSGSVSDAEFTHMVSEVNSAMRVLKPGKITMVPFDTVIREVTPIKNLTELRKCSFTGRGGTNITPVLDWAIQEKPQLLLIFTDGYFNMPRNIRPRSDVIWLIHNNKNFTAPFGKVIHYQLE
ncbi:VWA-like domain-containing protein [Xenophilus sp. Marseille-Q4582]|uniref:vWA domain-containing protein n=1 Tax=Xenophilus sp. Marseille-Q4582 TaxID=2866600 RepID=UPI001CE44D59|nr:VWA-like domain-containing protein [Xenophilus sp. Marseille-Q4582]